VVLVDNGGTDLGGADTSLPFTFTIVVSPVNDPPVVELAPADVVDDGSFETGALAPHWLARRGRRL